MLFSRQEQVRRSAMKSAKYMIKVLFNDLEVSRTATRLGGIDSSISQFLLFRMNL